MNAKLLVDSQCELGEGIQWNVDDNRIYWTDIHGKTLWSCDEDGGSLKQTALKDRLGSFAFDLNGDILAAFAKGLYRMRVDGSDCELLQPFEVDHPTSRFNDGRCDRQGRFVVGGLDENGLKQTSKLIRFSAGRSEVLREGIGCSNSICFSPDGTFAYFADTPTRRIESTTVDPETGAFGSWSLFHEVEDGNGFPDGSSVDANGALWNARFGGAHVQQIHADGSMGQRVDLPVPNITCAAFGGRDYDKLFITTAREHMSEADISQYPASGGIFVAVVDVGGLPEERFAEKLF